MRLLNDVHTSTLHKLTVLVILILFAGFFIPIWQPPINLYASYTDDFYYYLKIAESYTRGQGLCYSPGIHTNGFQPFFQFFIIVLVFAAHLFGAPELVFIRVILALVFAGFSLFLVRQLKPRGYAATFFFLLGLFGYYFIACSGMESLFIVPVLTYFVFKLSNNSISINRAALLVVIAFFLRIDSVFIALPLFLYYLRINARRHPQRWKMVFSSFLIIGLPLLVYFGLNYSAFGTFFPISGLAKNVTKIGGVNRAGLVSFAFYFPYNVFNVAVAGLYILVALTRNDKNKVWFHLLAILTIVFYLQTVIRSDWELWAWYFYPIPPLAFMLAAKGESLFAGNKPAFVRLNKLIYAGAAAFAAAVVVFAMVLWTYYTFPIRQTSPMGKGKVDILHIAGIHIQAFEYAHPGVYAMGDRAGIVGWFMNSPLIQLEGLVMDKEYMGRLSKARKLTDLLQPYNVNYYIASNPRQLNDSMYIVKEPVQSQGLSRQVTDTINWKIAYSFTLASKGVFSGRVNDQFCTVIFEVPK